MSTALWPYLPTLKRLALALAIGMFVGLERERRSKGVGLRTFGFVSLLGALGGLLGDTYAILALGFVCTLAVLLNIQAIRNSQPTELTTAAAMLVTGFAGLLCGQGHTLTPAALAVVTAALLAWKQPLAGFSQALTEVELRSAIVLAMLAFVIYPALPEGTIDPWALFQPRAAWLTVMLIAGIGFVNYILLKLYGAKGFLLTGFLGGLVNSTVTITELASKDRDSAGQLADLTYRGVIVATCAMLLRNLALLAILAPRALAEAALPFALMLAGGVLLARGRRSKPVAKSEATPEASPPQLPLESPFSITSALKFGAIFVALEVLGTVAQRGLGDAGFYTLSLIGGLVSSASAVASAGSLASQGTIEPTSAGIGAILASLASAAVNLPLIARIARDRALTKRLLWPLGAIVGLGLAGVAGTALFERFA